MQAARAASVVWLLGLCLVPGFGWAQTPKDVIGPGARIRVFNPALGDHPIIGRVIAVTGDTLAFTAPELGGPSRVLLDDRSRVETSIEQHNRAGRGLLIGGAVGLTIGSVIVGVRQMSNDIGETLGSAFGSPAPHKKVSQAPIFVGLVAGATLGALTGASMTVDDWVPARLPTHVSFGMSRDEAVQIRLSVSLSW